MTQPQPTISVIITCYNYAGFVATAIESVLNQTYPNKELVVVDDASSDHSREVIASYDTQLIPVLKTQNGGHGAAFNSGYEASSGDIVMFLDADDFLLPGALERIAAEYDPTVTMRQYRMDLVDAEAKAYDIFPKLEQAFWVGDQTSLLLRSGRVSTTVTSGLVFGRGFLKQVMPMPPEAFRQGGDGYLATMAPLYGSLADGGATPIAAYRQHGQNHSGFGALIEKRARWCVQHDEARYDALRDHAGRLGLTLTEPLGWLDEGHLGQKMALILHNAHPAPVPSRLSLSFAALRALRDTPMSTLNRVIVSLWWLALGLLPRSAAQSVHAWKLHAASRPAWMKKLARTLRKI